jgi:nucleotide-binding universal stress UspA family protein
MTYTRGRGAGLERASMSSDPIVVGTDGSASAEVAVDRAGQLAKALDAALHVVTVLESASAPEREAAAAEKVVADSSERLAARGARVQTHVRAGSASGELMKVAEAEHAQMIVVGNRGMTGGRRMLGSVPNDVSHYARCDVLIVLTQP